MSTCQVLGHHMEAALGQWDKDYPDLYCTRCGHCEPGVTLIRPGDPLLEADPLVARGEWTSFLFGWSVVALFALVVPVLIGILLSWAGAAIWWVLCILLVGMLGGDGDAGGASGSGDGSAFSMTRSPLS